MIRRPGAILALLTGLNLLNYLDRLVVSAVLPKIQEDLHLDNLMGGLLATVFLVGYFATAPIFGSLGDRTSRKWLIAGGVIVWSAATCASGLARNFTELVIARALVGVGEASYATLAPTIIDDITPPHRKGRALAYFYGATPFGAALGYLVGGFVEHRWGWRSAFFVAGGPGLLLALTCLAIREPARTARVDKADVVKDLGTLVKARLYRRGVLGYCAYTFAIGGFSYWAPKFLYARYGLRLDVANRNFGLIIVVAGVIATFIGGAAADRMRRRVEATSAKEHVESDAVKGLLRICAYGSFVGAPITLACFLAPSATLFFVLVFFAILALFTSTSPINGIVLSAVPPALRASAMALSIFAIHVLGDLWSPPLMGYLADRMAMQIAMMLVPVAVLVSAIVWWPPRRA
ncbi:MAG: Permease of the major facilitator superfamily [Labilithrix sp.]|nr:Permease of the major facilitator superfamily [Labilithrix sp.]